MRCSGAPPSWDRIFPLPQPAGNRSWELGQLSAGGMNVTGQGAGCIRHHGTRLGVLPVHPLFPGRSCRPPPGGWPGGEGVEGGGRNAACSPREAGTAPTQAAGAGGEDGGRGERERGRQNGRGKEGRKEGQSLRKRESKQDQGREGERAAGGEGEGEREERETDPNAADPSTHSDTCRRTLAPQAHAQSRGLGTRSRRQPEPSPAHTCTKTLSRMGCVHNTPTH